ncbi:hypothetical protein GCM10023166_29600 [Paeniglutamicibacter cryotolerans]
MEKTFAQAPNADMRRYWALVLNFEWVQMCRRPGRRCREGIAAKVSRNSCVAWSRLQWTWTRRPARWNSSGSTTQIPFGWSP